MVAMLPVEDRAVETFLEDGLGHGRVPHAAPGGKGSGPGLKPRPETGQMVAHGRASLSCSGCPGLPAEPAGANGLSGPS